MKASRAVAPGTPTQVAHPWRAVIRTFVAAAVGVAVTWLATLGIDLEALAPALTESITYGLVTIIAAGVTWLLARPGVERFLERYAPFLATGVATERPSPAPGEDI